MSLQERINELAQLVAEASLPPTNGEMRAQYLAATYRRTLLENTPEDLPQLHFLCILAATLGRFVRDAAQPGEADNLAVLLSVMIRRHAGTSSLPLSNDPTTDA